MNIPMKLRNFSWGGGERGERGEFLKIAGSRLGKLLPATLSVNYFLQTNKKNFHSQNEKKDEKQKKRRKTQSYCHIVFESLFLSSTEK